jgi:tRNA-specific 2-thiouridylase
LFPLGQYKKYQVKQLAQEYELPNRNRRDLKGQNFFGRVNVDDFVFSYLGSKPGPIIDASTGDLLGEHNGIWYHTVGKEIQFGIDEKAESRGPWYAIAKDAATASLFCLNYNKYDESLTNPPPEIAVENLHWIFGCPPPIQQVENSSVIYRFQMIVKYGSAPIAGKLKLDSVESTDGAILLKESVGGLTPGQYISFYNDNGQCLGCGVISNKYWSSFLTRTD